MHLAVGAVVHDDDGQREPKFGRYGELLDREHRVAVADERDDGSLALAILAPMAAGRP